MEREPLERPILFSGPMVRAVLEGRKTQTRRVVRQPGRLDGLMLAGEEASWCPYGGPGDRLWVRETWADISGAVGRRAVAYRASCRDDELEIVVDGGVSRIRVATWRPSIHMPRWASRLALEVVGVRLQRLQEISEEDAKAEGMRAQAGDGLGPGPGFKWRGIGYEGSQSGAFHAPDAQGRCTCNLGGRTPAQCAFRDLWAAINGKRAPWESNPWVWAVTFQRVQEVEPARGNPRQQRARGLPPPPPAAVSPNTGPEGTPP